MDILTDLSLKVVVGAITAVIASYVTVKLSLKRFYYEKWWEKKEEAYSAILEALHHMKRSYDEDLKAAQSGREIPEEQEKIRQAKFSDAYDELKKRIDLGQFVLSEVAVDELSKFQKVYRDAGNAPDWVEYLDDSWTAINETLKRMRRIAKDDLKGH